MAVLGNEEVMRPYNDPQNKAFAGTGRPTKELVCRVSLLNLASRNAENTEIKKAAYGR